MVFLAILSVFILIGIALILWSSLPRRRLSDESRRKYRAELAKYTHLSPTEQILSCDKLLSHILRDLGYEGNLGEQLKQNPGVLSDLDHVWELHKLRNRLAHDLHSISENTLTKQAAAYRKEIERLLRNYK